MLSLLLVSGLMTSCLHDPVALRQEKRTTAFDLLTKGQQLKADGDYLLARDLFLRALDVSPRPVVYYEIGNSYYRLGRYQEAIAWYDKALNAKPSYQLASAEKELAQVRLGGEEPQADVAQPPRQPTESKQSNQSTGSTGPGGLLSGITGQSAQSGESSALDAADYREIIFPELTVFEDLESDTLAARGSRALAGNRYSEAVMFYRELTEREPSNGTWHRELGTAHIGEGRYRAAYESLSTAVTLTPDDPQAHFELGNYHISNGDELKAQEAFRRAVELDSTHTQAKNNLGVTLLKADKPGEAVPLFREITEQEPEFATAWLNLALAMSDTKASPTEISEILENYLRRLNDPDVQAEKWLRELRRSIAAQNS